MSNVLLPNDQSINLSLRA